MKTKYLDFYKINFGTAKYCTKSWGLASFEAGTQSRQAEINAITKQRDSFIKAHHIAINDVCENKAKIGELQARIDEALGKCRTGIRKQGGDYYLELVGDILKGNKDEN